jgi:predicted ATPase
MQAAGADLTLEAGDGPAIAEICWRLEAIPLAIELAAARVIALAPAEIAAHLDERVRLLTGAAVVPSSAHEGGAEDSWAPSIIGREILGLADSPQRADRC